MFVSSFLRQHSHITPPMRAFLISFFKPHTEESWEIPREPVARVGRHGHTESIPHFTNKRKSNEMTNADMEDIITNLTEQMYPPPPNQIKFVAIRISLIFRSFSVHLQCSFAHEILPLDSGGTGNNFNEFFRDDGLSGSVVRLLELVDHLGGVLGRVIHSRHPERMKEMRIYSFDGSKSQRAYVNKVIVNERLIYNGFSFPTLD